jgi:WD40 repeat protein
VVLSVDFFQDDKFLVSTNLEGDVDIISSKDNFNVIKHETIEAHSSQLRTNTAFCCTTVKNSQSEAGVFLVGSENKHITKYRFDFRDYELERVGSFVGHSNSVRNVQVSKNLQHVLSCCEDHSLRVWDYNTFQPKIILTGHRDNVSGGAFVNENTIVSSSWDLRVMIWKI